MYSKTDEEPLVETAEDNSTQKVTALTRAAAMTASLPRVGTSIAFGLGGFDFALSYSHLYAIYIAKEALSKISAEERNKIQIEILTIFDEWKYEHGTYPPHDVSSLLSRNISTPRSAKTYCDHLTRENALLKKDERARLPEAWECCSSVFTPVALFDKLWGEDYKPLVNYLHGNNPDSYPYILAILILLSHKDGDVSQTGDCIHAAMKLAQHQIYIKERQIEAMSPLAEEAWNRKRLAKLQADTKKEETERVILEEYHSLCGNDRQRPKKLQATIALNTGKTQATVSKVLNKYGFGREEQKKLS